MLSFEFQTLVICQHWNLSITCQVIMWTKLEWYGRL